MSKPPSDATTIKNLRRELRRANDCANERVNAAIALRGQLTRAQQEVAEWKKRFDALLSKMPKDIPL